MVSTFKYKDLLPVCPCYCGSDSHHVRLGPGIGEPDELHRRCEALTNELGKLFLIQIISPKTPSSTKSLTNSCLDGSIVVPVDASSVFAEEVDVGMTVEGGECTSVAGGKCHGKRVGVEDCASIASWEVHAGRLVGVKRGRIELSVCRVGSP